MKFYKNLYLGDSIKKKKLKLIWKLRSHATLFDIYVFIRPEEDGEIEYFNSNYLKQKYYRRHKYLILGIANGAEEAEKLLNCMLQDAFKETGKYDLKTFFASTKELV